MSEELSQIVAELRLIRQALERLSPAPERPLSAAEVEFWRMVEDDDARVRDRSSSLERARDLAIRAAALTDIAMAPASQSIPFASSGTRL